MTTNGESKDEIFLRFCKAANTEVIAALLEFGANANCKGEASGQTPLICVAREGNIESVQLLLERGAKVNETDNKGCSPLMAAAANGKAPIVRMLVKAGADVKAQDIDARTPLIYAARKGNGKTFLALMRKSDIGHKDVFGMDALMAASECGHGTVVRYLIEAKADLDVKSNEGMTPLMLAASNGHMDAVEELCYAWADMQARDNSGLNALMHAERHEHEDVAHFLHCWLTLVLAKGKKAEELKEALLKTPDVNFKSPDGETALLLAAANGDETSVALLLEAGADPWIKNEQGKTAHDIAMGKGDERLLRLLLGAGGERAQAFLPAVRCGNVEIAKSLLRLVDVNKKGSNGEIPVILAVQSKSVPMLKLLLDAGAKVNAKDEKGMTALMFACAEGPTDAVRVLLEAGAKIEERDSDGLTALLHAGHNNHASAMRILIQAGANIEVRDNRGTSSLESSAGEAAAELVRAGVNVWQGLRDFHRWTRTGSSLIWAAVERRSENLISALVSRGANIEATDDRKRTPLHLAVWYRHPENVQGLLENGANVNARDFEESTPLMLACAEGVEEIVRMLLEFGATIDLQDRNGWSALAYAAKAGRLEISKILLAAGADVNIGRKRDGFSPLFCAVFGGNADILQEFIRAGARIDGRIHNGQTPLMIAAEQGDLELVKVLVKAGAKINDQDGSGRTPLFSAIREGYQEYKEVVAFLLGLGANPNIPCAADGDTPLIRAAVRGDPSLVDMLLQAGAYTNARNKKGQTALQKAIDFKRKNVIHLLS